MRSENTRHSAVSMAKFIVLALVALILSNSILLPAPAYAKKSKEKQASSGSNSEIKPTTSDVMPLPAPSPVPQGEAQQSNNTDTSALSPDNSSRGTETPSTEGESIKPESSLTPIDITPSASPKERDSATSSNDKPAKSTGKKSEPAQLPLSIKGQNGQSKISPLSGGMQTPSEDMPPPAPEIQKEVQPSPSQLFNLQAQQIDVRAADQRNMLPPPAMQGMMPRYGMGQPYYGNAQNYNANANGNYLNGNVNQSGDPRTLTQVDLRKMANHEVVLLIDRSSSMTAMDCPNVGGSTHQSFAPKMGGLMSALMGVPLLSSMGMGTSRWEWCLHQTSDLSRQTQQIYSQGITVVLFSSGFVTLPNVTLDQLPRVFNDNFPFGGTNLGPALGSQIGEYFRRREYTGGNIKPLMIGIITDGCPNNRQAVRQAIIQATQLMRGPQEITIIFFLIGGMDYVGEAFVQDLTVNLVRQGARFPIVRAVSFGELQRLGLAKAIADNLQ